MCRRVGVWPLRRGSRLPATGYWRPATGYWLPATGYWLLATGYWLLATGYWLLPPTTLNLRKFRAFVAGMLRAVMLLGLTGTVAVSQPLEYPRARRTDFVDDYFGTKVPDSYRWLEDSDSPETQEWVKAENEITSAYLDKLADREPFKERLTKLLNYQRYTAPSWEGQRYLYRKNEGLQNQSVIYTLKKLNETPKILLDPNQLASDGTMAVTSTTVSDDSRLLAYGIAASGSDWNIIRVRDIDTGQDLPDVIKWVKFSEPSWTKDSKGFFYSRFPEPNGSGNRLLPHSLIKRCITIIWANP